MKKKLTIVCDDSKKSYCHYLSQLISSRDDVDDKVVGTEDGTVEAAIWDEKEYKQNLARLSSAGFVVFVGDGEVARGVRQNMAIKFDKCGIQYGWLGTQAFLRVDAAVDPHDYDDFKALCERVGQSPDEELKRLLTAPSLPSAERQNELAKGSKDPLEAAKAAASDALGFLNSAASDVAKKVEIALRTGQIIDLQYRVAIALFYLDGLSSFLGE
ncbi:hypothetical protein [Paratractidigestivibacter sp.]|uniref:hypothetical protein n=1 Tax=Paratractidigestivibacter sp. TaxID=2847316 RepID=UPI002ABD495D|nr:hypothetical protein [Paratractidigestivibacter sp.]